MLVSSAYAQELKRAARPSNVEYEVRIGKAARLMVSKAA